AAVAEDLPCGGACRGPHPVGLPAAALEPPQLLDDLVEQDHHVAVGQEAVQRIRILDERGRIGDVDRAGERSGVQRHPFLGTTPDLRRLPYLPGSAPERKLRNGEIPARAVPGSRTERV